MRSPHPGVRRGHQRSRSARQIHSPAHRAFFPDRASKNATPFPSTSNASSRRAMTPPFAPSSASNRMTRRSRPSSVPVPAAARHSCTWESYKRSRRRTPPLDTFGPRRNPPPSPACSSPSTCAASPDPHAGQPPRPHRRSPAASRLDGLYGSSFLSLSDPDFRPDPTSHRSLSDWGHPSWLDYLKTLCRN